MMKSVNRRINRRKWKLRLRIAKRIIDGSRDSASVGGDGSKRLNSPTASSSESSSAFYEGDTFKDCNDSSSGCEDDFRTEGLDSAKEAVNGTVFDAVARVSDANEVSSISDLSDCDSETSKGDDCNEFVDLSEVFETDSESLESNSDEPTPTPLQYLYPGSNVPSHDFNVALLSIAHKHSLTNSSVVDILKLFSEVLPTSAQIQSRHMLMKHFVDHNEMITDHRCCGYCSRLLSNSNCDTPECQAAEAPEGSFIQICIIKQLQTLYSGLCFNIIFSGTVSIISFHRFS